MSVFLLCHYVNLIPSKQNLTMSIILVFIFRNLLFHNHSWCFYFFIFPPLEHLASTFLFSLSARFLLYCLFPLCYSFLSTSCFFIHSSPSFLPIHLATCSQTHTLTHTHTHTHTLTHTHTHTHTHTVSYTICCVWDCIYVLEAFDWFCMNGILLGFQTVLIFNRDQKNGKWAWEVCVYFYLPPFGVSATSASWQWIKRKNNRMRGKNIPTFSIHMWTFLKWYCWCVYCVYINVSNWFQRHPQRTDWHLQTQTQKVVGNFDQHFSEPGTACIASINPM